MLTGSIDPHPVITLCPKYTLSKFSFDKSLVELHMKNCWCKNVVNLVPSLTYHDQNYRNPWINSVIRICNQDNFDHDRLKIDQNLPYFYTDNCSRNLRVLDKMYFGRSVINCRTPIQDPFTS